MRFGGAILKLALFAVVAHVAIGTPLGEGLLGGITNVDATKTKQIQDKSIDGDHNLVQTLLSVVAPVGVSPKLLNSKHQTVIAKSTDAIVDPAAVHVVNAIVDKTHQGQDASITGDHNKVQSLLDVLALVNVDPEIGNSEKQVHIVHRRSPANANIEKTQQAQDSSITGNHNLQQTLLDLVALVNVDPKIANSDHQVHIVHRRSPANANIDKTLQAQDSSITGSHNLQQTLVDLAALVNVDPKILNSDKQVHIVHRRSPANANVDKTLQAQDSSITGSHNLQQTLVDLAALVNVDPKILNSDKQVHIVHRRSPANANLDKTLQGQDASITGDHNKQQTLLDLLALVNVDPKILNSDHQVHIVHRRSAANADITKTQQLQDQSITGDGNVDQTLLGALIPVNVGAGILNSKHQTNIIHSRSAVVDPADLDAINADVEKTEQIQDQSITGDGNIDQTLLDAFVPVNVAADLLNSNQQTNIIHGRSAGIADSAALHAANAKISKIKQLQDKSIKGHGNIKQTLLDAFVPVNVGAGVLNSNHQTNIIKGRSGDLNVVDPVPDSGDLQAVNANVEKTEQIQDSSIIGDGNVKQTGVDAFVPVNVAGEILNSNQQINIIKGHPAAEEAAAVVPAQVDPRAGNLIADIHQSKVDQSIIGDHNDVQKLLNAVLAVKVDPKILNNDEQITIVDGEGEAHVPGAAKNVIAAKTQQVDISKVHGNHNLLQTLANLVAKVNISPELLNQKKQIIISKLKPKLVTTTPLPSGDTTTLPPSGDTTTLPPSGETTTLPPGGDTTTPAGGITTTTPAGQTTPAPVTTPKPYPPIYHAPPSHYPPPPPAPHHPQYYPSEYHPSHDDGAYATASLIPSHPYMPKHYQYKKPSGSRRPGASAHAYSSGKSVAYASAYGGAHSYNANAAAYPAHPQHNGYANAYANAGDHYNRYSYANAYANGGHASASSGYHPQSNDYHYEGGHDNYAHPAEYVTPDYEPVTYEPPSYQPAPYNTVAYEPITYAPPPPAPAYTRPKRCYRRSCLRWQNAPSFLCERNCGSDHYEIDADDDMLFH